MIVPLPEGMADGIIAITCVDDTEEMGAASDVPFTVTCTDVPASEVCSGSPEACADAGPRVFPLMMKIDPCAMAELGIPEIAWLAAFSTPPDVIAGDGAAAAAVSE